MSQSVEKFIASMKQMISEMGNVSGKLKNQADSSKGVSGDEFGSGNPVTVDERVERDG